MTFELRWNRDGIGVVSATLWRTEPESLVATTIGPDDDEALAALRRYHAEHITEPAFTADESAEIAGLIGD